MTVFSLFMGADIRGDLIGIVVGHFYYFLSDVMNIRISAPDVMYLIYSLIFCRKEIVPDFSRKSGPRQTPYGYTVNPPREHEEEKKKENPASERDKVFLGRGRKLNE
jgi:hypothetical protein